jgi:phosphatidylserine/phosphatidylglycerophosphate/cardiolipin synthase-like enzyme
MNFFYFGPLRGRTAGAVRIYYMRTIRRFIIVFCIACLPAVLAGSGWWELYFTSPGMAGQHSKKENPAAGLIGAINRSTKSFYGAFYEISEPRIVRALINAKKRGVEVRLVTETNTARKRKNVQSEWRDAGIEIVYDTGKGLMHNKFAIIDASYVWTGSYNPTVNDTEKNNNNAILIRSVPLAGIYRGKFMRMFQEKSFGKKRKAGPFSGVTNDYYVKVEGTDINAYFSPEDDIERIILKRLSKAKTAIHFMAFAFTSDNIGEMMIRMHKQGVRVCGLFERKGSRVAHSEYMKMKLEGLPVKLDHNRNLMHHKVIIIDEYRIITGSYNFSRNANQSNDENLLILDNREIAAAYLAEFNRLYR